MKVLSFYSSSTYFITLLTMDEIRVLENGLVIEEIPRENRTKAVCLNAMIWAKKHYQTDDYTIRRDLCIRIMKSFPDEILLESWIIGNLLYFT